MSIKISSLEVENVKRVKAVSLTPTAEGLTVLGGRNGQGKTSVLDSRLICSTKETMIVTTIVTASPTALIFSFIFTLQLS